MAIFVTERPLFAQINSTMSIRPVFRSASFNFAAKIMIAHGGGTQRPQMMRAFAAGVSAFCQRHIHRRGTDLRRMLWQSKKLNRNTLRAASRRDGWRVCMTGQYLGGCRTRRRIKIVPAVGAALNNMLSAFWNCTTHKINLNIISAAASGPHFL